MYGGHKRQIHRYPVRLGGYGGKASRKKTQTDRETGMIINSKGFT